MVFLCDVIAPEQERTARTKELSATEVNINNTSYGHVLKVENDEKQSNPLGRASEHRLEASRVLHSQQVN